MSQAAVDKQLRAGDEGSLVADQEGDCVADVFRDANALHHLAALRLALLSGGVVVAVKDALDERGEHPARGNRVNPDRRPVVDRHVAGQGGDAAFGGTVWGNAVDGLEGMHR